MQVAVVRPAAVTVQESDMNAFTTLCLFNGVQRLVDVADKLNNELQSLST
jgi:hypothetical protein